MKKIFFISLVLPSFCFAQSRDTETSDSTLVNKWKFGINIASNLQNFIGFTVTPSFMMKKGQHALSLGPKVFLDYGEYIPLGLDANYKYIPNGINKTINFYFTAHFSIEGDKSQRSTYYIDFYTGQKIDVNKSSEELYLGLYIGYGLDIKFLKRFHLQQFIGFGFAAYKYQYIDEYPLNPSFNSERKGKFLNNINPWAILNFGLGLDIGKSTHNN